METRFVGAHLPADLYRALRAQAAAEDRPLVYVIRRALASDLERRGHDVPDPVGKVYGRND